MILHAEGGDFLVTEAGDGVVVEVAVGNFEAGGERIFLDGKAVILGGDLYFARKHVQDGLIGAAVAELELKCLRAAGEAEQLMAESDSENGNLAQYAANAVLGVVERLGIAGAVAEENPVGLV